MKKEKPRLAIISTYDDLCGIASYARALVRQLSPYFNITVFDLDQYVFRHTSRYVRKMADKEIERICKEIRGFDCVNVQLEHGIFGRNKRDSYKRICKIISAAPTLSITFHTVFDGSAVDWKAVRQELWRFNISKAWSLAVGSRLENTLLGAGIYGAIRRAQWTKKVSVVVHTRRDGRTLRVVERIKNVHDHPLAYYSRGEAAEYARTASRDEFPLLKDCGDDVILLGCFGFTGTYKGIDTAIRALHLLPENYHLAIFGGVHPEAIQRGVALDPYISELLQIVNPGRSWLDDVQGAAGKAVNLNATISELLNLADTPHIKDISHRTHFMGPMTDDEMPRAMEICDAVLLPYLEVGQSASGPMSMAVNLNRPVIATRTKTFLQFCRYYPGRVSLFDIGNFLQLSQIIRTGAFSMPQHNADDQEPGTESNIATYCKALFFNRAT
ncbi:hypothetical protein WI80_09470 [Burkholderia ubonensis]|uniref:hypothetical protein n=1 Tax=Burkholderia ubonensis TaxID=101571 RepID=UPI00075695E6|nr:hypothetical protein [Burkholderia ubonensis]KVD13342.1 hypothetical protein WI80_09470 [Burkholderia ubonensis]KVU16586.1 hypothetical protein WK63_13640 [Burkholderia ubonensis]